MMTFHQGYFQKSKNFARFMEITPPARDETTPSERRCVTTIL
jgi:hypothetical protein